MDYINGFDNRYRINRNGEVFSCIYNKLMKPQLNDDGYLVLSLTNNTKKKIKCSIHRLLALQYIPNPEGNEQIDHIDRNKLNNDLSNLRWVSQTENRNNRTDLLCLKTEEELEERKQHIKEYKTLKAREYRERDKDLPKPVKTEEEILKMREYKKLKAREYREKKLRNL